MPTQREHEEQLDAIWKKFNACSNLLVEKTARLEVAEKKIKDIDAGWKKSIDYNEELQQEIMSLENKVEQLETVVSTLKAEVYDLTHPTGGSNG